MVKCRSELVKHRSKLVRERSELVRQRGQTVRERNELVCERSEADWVSAQVTTQATVELTGLTPLTKYWFRVGVVTISGTSDFCDPISQGVL